MKVNVNIAYFVLLLSPKTYQRLIWSLQKERQRRTQNCYIFSYCFFFFFLIFVCVFVLWLLWVCFGNIRLKSSSNNRELIAHKNEEISFLNLKHLNMSHFNIYNFDKERQIRRFRCNANHLTYL